MASNTFKMSGKRKSTNTEDCCEQKRFKYSEESLLKAVGEIKEGKMSLNVASRVHNIPKGTLHNKVKNKVPMERKMGPATILTNEEESNVEKWIIDKAKLGFPMRADDVKDSIQKVLIECPRENPFTDNRPGDKWLSLFLRRHPEIVKRNTEAISKARASVTKENLTQWFTDLTQFLQDNNYVDIFEDGRRVLNCDETGCVTCPNTGKVLGPKHFRNLYEINLGNAKESITVLCTYSADGATLPPMVVYPYKRIPTEIVRNIPEGWTLGRSDSGWMVSATFFEYVTKVLKPWLKEKNVPLPVILFLDGHKSHLSLQLSKFCAENKIIVYCLPPNATHIIQPCDVGIFRPLKVAWKNAVRRAKQLAISINKKNFAKLFQPAFDSVRKEVIINSFKTCGLFPLNLNAIDYSKCISVRRTEINKENEESLPTFLDYSATKNVIEYTIKEERLKIFMDHLKRGTYEDGDDKNLFLLWKTCVLNYSSEKSNPTLGMDIMSMPMEIVEDDNYNRDVSHDCVTDVDILYPNDYCDNSQEIGDKIIDSLDDNDNYDRNKIDNLASTSNNNDCVTDVDILYPNDYCDNSQEIGDKIIDSLDDNDNYDRNKIDNLASTSNNNDCVTDVDILYPNDYCDNSQEIGDKIIDSLDDNDNYDRNKIDNLASTSNNNDCVTDVDIFYPNNYCVTPQESGKNFFNYSADYDNPIQKDIINDLVYCDITKDFVQYDPSQGKAITPLNANEDKIKQTWRKRLDISQQLAENTSKKKTEKNYKSFCITLPEWRDAEEKKEKEQEEKQLIKLQRMRKRQEKKKEEQKIKEEKEKEKCEKMKKREEKKKEEQKIKEEKEKEKCEKMKKREEKKKEQQKIREEKEKEKSERMRKREDKKNEESKIKVQEEKEKSKRMRKREDKKNEESKIKEQKEKEKSEPEAITKKAKPKKKEKNTGEGNKETQQTKELFEDPPKED